MYMSSYTWVSVYIPGTEIYPIAGQMTSTTDGVKQKNMVKSGGKPLWMRF